MSSLERPYVGNTSSPIVTLVRQVFSDLFGNAKIDVHASRGSDGNTVDLSLQSDRLQAGIRGSADSVDLTIKTFRAPVTRSDGQY